VPTTMVLGQGTLGLTHFRNVAVKGKHLALLKKLGDSAAGPGRKYREWRLLDFADRFATK